VGLNGGQGKSYVEKSERFRFGSSGTKIKDLDASKMMETDSFKL
jgi:hypothetical protein